MFEQRYRPWLLTLVTLAGGAILASGSLMAADQQRASVPLILEDGHRPHVDVRLRGPSGEEGVTRMLVDTGGGAFIIPEALARDIGLEWGDTIRDGPHEMAPVTTPPEAYLGALRLALAPERVLVQLESGDEATAKLPGGLFPGHLLARYHVILDYPGETLTLAEPGTVEPRGESLPMEVSDPQGFPRVVLEIDDREVGFLLDSGPPVTIVSQALLEQWAGAHPDWPRSEGATGTARHLAAAGGQVLETMEVPGARWGGLELEAFTVASQSTGAFERYMSSMMTAPIKGALGSNVLRRFRVELDYANEAVYLAPADNP